MMFDANRVKTWIPKKIKHAIEIVEEDSEVVEVVLHNNYINGDAESVWIFAKERYELREYNLGQIKEDLIVWLGSIEEVEVN